jgi:hypothetical protein
MMNFFYARLSGEKRKKAENPRPSFRLYYFGAWAGASFGAWLGGNG